MFETWIGRPIAGVANLAHRRTLQRGSQQRRGHHPNTDDKCRRRRAQARCRSWRALAGGRTSPSSLGVVGLDGVGITLITPASNKQAIVACG
jgi:hypothetical protein